MDYIDTCQYEFKRSFSPKSLPVSTLPLPALSQPRADLVQQIENSGGKFHSAVTRHTNYLITNNPSSNSAKLTAAKKLGVKIITENDFQKLL